MGRWFLILVFASAALVRCSADGTDSESNTAKRGTLDDDSMHDGQDGMSSDVVIDAEKSTIEKSETMQLSVKYRDPEDSKVGYVDISDRVKWSVSGEAGSVSAAGLLTGLRVGKLSVSIESSSPKVKTSREFSITCPSEPIGTAKDAINLRAENFPGNATDPGGADFDDYYLKLNGAFKQDSYEIVAAEDQVFTVLYSEGNKDQCTHVVSVQTLNCENELVDEELFGTAPNTVSVKAKKGQRINFKAEVSCNKSNKTTELVIDQGQAFQFE